MAEPRARLPSWISMEMDEGRQPSRRRTTGAAAVTPYMPRSTKSSAKRPPKATVTPSSPPWEERKMSRRAGRGPTVPRESFLVGLCRQLDWKAAWIHLQEHPEQAEPVQLIREEEDLMRPTNLHLREYSKYSRHTPKEGPLVYQETPLCLLCSLAKFAPEDLPTKLLQELVRISPKQAIVSHVDTGHTALRALLRNETCNPKALSQLLLQGMKQNCSEEQFRRLCTLPDRDGLTPMDHVVLAFHQYTCTSRSAAPLEILKVFVEISGASDRVMAGPAVSPLIRLLSLGSASSVARLGSTASSPPLSSTSLDLAHPSHQSRQVLEATKYFIQKFPLLLDQASRTTQCTPLHVALRNYGNFAALIQCFLVSDTESEETEQASKIISPMILKSLQQENQFGDLPLHVASSVGVPLPILKLVLEGTLQATATSSRHNNSRRHQVNLCWTVNHAGYTPIDLEWIRHMEDGKGLFMARSFYPLEVGGIKKTFWKQDEFYRVLLQQAVQQAMDVRATNPFLRAFRSNNPQRIMDASLPPSFVPTAAAPPFAPRPAAAGRRTPRAGQTPPQQTAYVYPPSPPPQPSEQPTWELLLHRIFLITQTAATGQVPKTQMELVECLLHSACKLSFPVAPSLPLPLLELILFMYPEQLLLPQPSLRKEEETNRQPGQLRNNTTNEHDQGNLPLHFALQLHLAASSCPPSMPPLLGATSPDNEAAHEHTCTEWEAWVKQLLEHGPEACSTTNLVGQLPLHKALEHHDSPYSCGQTAQEQSTKGKSNQKKLHTLTPQEKVRLHVVRAVVEAFPNSVNAADPVSHLMPFQMAAASPCMPLDAVFYLLRRSPDAVLAH